MAHKKSKDERAAIQACIAEMPTASDAQVAAAATEQFGEKVRSDTVADVRAEMGAKHTWPKSKE